MAAPGRRLAVAADGGCRAQALGVAGLDVLVPDIGNGTPGQAEAL